MADTRTVVLVLSPHAAQLVRECVGGVAEGLRSQAWADDCDQAVTPNDLPVLDAVTTELDAQRATLPPLDAKAIAERMANAAREAVAL